MKIVFLLIIIFSSISISANDKNLYQKAYEIESISTLFAIPLYEQSLSSSNSKNLQKAAVSRLFYLYKKHNKLIEALLLGSKYSKIIPSKERSSVWSAIAEIYRPVKYDLLSSAYVLAVRTNHENYPELLNFMKSAYEPKLNDFIFVVLYKRKQFETLQLLLKEDRSISTSPLYAGMIAIKLDSDGGKSFLESLDAETDRDVSFHSDLFYLLGQYYRSLGDHRFSARYFRMSGSFNWNERAKLESAKSLVLSGNFSEACSTFDFKPAPNEEVGQTFYLICNKKDKSMLKEIKPSFKVLGSKEGGDFFQKVNQALEKWDL